MKVSCTRLNHPWIAMAYRLDCDRATRSSTSTDTAPFRDILIEKEYIRQPPKPGDPMKPEDAAKLRAMRDGVVRLCEGADIVIYDTQFTPRSTRQAALGPLVPGRRDRDPRAAGAKSVGLFHHAPERTDDQIDESARLKITRNAARGGGRRHGDDLVDRSAAEGMEGCEVGDGSESGRLRSGACAARCRRQDPR